ncbi:MAG: response regulator, partial [Planctomycetota bacterium]|nr:response regulator [Planctomycetota bacterium]
MKGPPAALRILLVEDNPGDVRLTREAIRASDARVEVTVAEDGEAALSLLEEKENLPSGHLPDVVLLDLNLPGMSGKDVLREVKSNTQWEHIP